MEKINCKFKTELIYNTQYIHMIDSAILFARGKIQVSTSANTDPRTFTAVQAALAELCKNSISKVIQMDTIRLSVSTVKIRNEIIGFAAFGTGTDPKALLDLSADLAEVYIQRFSKLDFEDRQVQNSIAKEFENFVIDANKKLNQKSQTIIEIDSNLKEATDLSRQSVQKFMERGNALNDLDNQSGNLSKQALDFQMSGKRLREDIQRQKMRVLVIAALFIFFSFFFIIKKII